MQDQQKSAELAKLDAGIASQEARARAQRRHIAELRTTGRDIGQALDVLAAMEMTLDAWRKHRRERLDALERAEAGASAEPIKAE